MSVIFKPGDIVSLKLTTSEEVVARLGDTSNAEIVVLSKPMSFMMGPNGVGLIPFMLSAGKEYKVSIPREHVLCMIEPDNNVGTQYQRQTSSIVIAA